MDFFKEQSYTTQQIDDMVKEFLEYKNKLANLEDQVKATKEAMEESKQGIITAMEESLKDKWSAHGFNISLKTEKFPKLIKDPEGFKELEKYLKEVGGDDLYYAYTTINHQSLRTLVKHLQEERPDDIIPNVDLSFERKTLSVRKAK